MAARLKLTYQDYLLLPDDGKRYEILDGDLYMTPSPSVQHQRISGKFFQAFAQHVEAHRLGEVFTAPLDVILAEDSIAQPDLLFLSTERLSIAREVVHGASDFVLEILSPGTRERDRTLKRYLYARYGVRELWLVDPEARFVEVLRLDSAADTPLRIFANRDVLTSDMLPGLGLAVDTVWP
jgi:Uma2 family endonuclease